MVVKNFLFHRVSDDDDSLWPPMPTALFERLIGHITRQYRVVSLENFLRSPGPVRSKKKLATVLFDDGYRDNIEYAVPILAKYDCPASFYVVTDSIDLDIPTWTYIVDYLFQNTQASALKLDASFVPVDLRNSEFTDHRSRLSFAGRLKPWMKTLPNHLRQQVMAHLQSAFPEIAIPKGKMMTWDHLRQLHTAGYEVGSHSRTHPLLATIKDDGELEDELRESGKRIEKMLGYFPATISYPVGSYDDRVIRIAKQWGYTYGLAVKQKFYHPDADDLFSIPRVELYAEPFWKCRLRISGSYQGLKTIIGRE